MSYPQRNTLTLSKVPYGCCAKDNRNLSEGKRQRLRNVFLYSTALKLAYALREELSAIFELPLTCFNKFLTAMANWLQEIANYFVRRLSSGFVEGLNNKACAERSRSIKP